MSASDIVTGLERSGVRTVVAHPDSWMAGLLTRLREHPTIRLVPVSREEEGLALAAGLALSGQPGCVAMQNGGLLSLGNTIATLVQPYALPVLMLVSNRGTHADPSIYQSPKGRRTVAVLKAHDVPYAEPAPGADMAREVELAVRSAAALRGPYCLLLGREVLS